MKKIVFILLMLLTICSTTAFAEGGFMKSNITETMAKDDKLAILMIHFGTTYDVTRAETIDTINLEAKEKFPNVEVREAYTSRIIMRKLKKRLIFKYNPVEVLDQLLKDGYTHVIVQPTNIINGIEAKTLEVQLEPYKNKFKEIRVGEPLLTTPEDFKEVVAIINKQVGTLSEDEGVVLVGHGTEDCGNMSYPAMDYTAKSMGSKFYVGTIESFPEIDDVVKGLKKDNIKKVILMPFMFVAGDHANNDIAVDWKENLEKAGFEVEVKLISLGMMKDIRNIFLKHLNFAFENKKEDMIAKKLFYSKQNN